jgi:hypothetical protein
MKKRLFIEDNIAPTEVLLRNKLGTTIDYYMTVLSKFGRYQKQWQFNRGNGWILKVGDMRNAFCYMSLFEDGIEISLTVRDFERIELLKSGELGSLYSELQAATKYSGGYALRFGIESSTECSSVAEFLESLMKMRSGTGILS